MWWGTSVDTKLNVENNGLVYTQVQASPSYHGIFDWLWEVMSGSVMTSSWCRQGGGGCWYLLTYHLF
jgi:hypothetical protein